MARDAAGRRKPVWIRIVAIGVLVIGGGALAAVFVPQMLFPTSADVALIRGDSEPFKIKPKDAGGVKIPHQETTVMGMLGGVASGNEDVEILTPPAAVPEMPPTPVSESEKIDVASEPARPSSEAKGQSQVAVQGVSPQADQTDILAPPADDAPVDLTVQQDKLADASVDQSAEQASGMTMPVQKPSSEPDENSDDRKVTKQIDIGGDEPLYIVQLAAFRDPGKAMEQAGLLGKNHAKRLNGVELGTMKIDTGDNGVFWRVVTEPLQRADADALCGGLKRAGQDCILRKFTLLSQ